MSTLNRSAAAFAAVFFSAALLAQTDRGTITGAVLDPAGAAVPGSQVVARNTETGAEYDTVTTVTGNYTLSQIPVGNYELRVGADGFSKFVQQGIRIFAAQTARIDINLKVGGTTESITVNADAPLLKTENAVQSTTIAKEKLDDLPLNFGVRGNASSGNIRNPLTFVALVPGGDISSFSSIKLNGTPLNTSSVSIEGQEANNFRSRNRLDQTQPSIESLQEVSVQTSNFSAENGAVSGGLINMTAKSGTNQFHGSGFEYFVNEDLSAGIPFTSSGNGHLLRPVNRRNDYGFSVGGPVWIPKLYNGRNKTFFFYSYEKFHQNQNVTGVLQTMPTEAMRTGDFSAALTGRTLGTDPLGRAIMENSIYDPLTTRLVNGQSVRDPFPGNKIDPARLDPVALKIQALIPKPTRPGIINNWDQSYPAATDETIPSIKMDQYLGNLGKVSFFFSQYYGPHYNFSDGLPIPITGVSFLATTTQTGRINYDKPITPTLLLHMGIGFVHHYNPFTALDGVLNYDIVGQTGLKASVKGKGFPVMSGLFSTSGGGMSVTSQGGTNNMGYAGNIPSSDKPTAVVSMTWVRGSHTYKTGGDWRVDGLSMLDLTGTTGIFGFAPGQVSLPYTQGQSIAGGNIGLPYASFALGLVNTASVSNDTDPQWRKSAWSLFVQDNWKVTRKLTLDYGLRWDLQTRAVEIHRRSSSFAPSIPNPAAGGLLGATMYDGYAPGACQCNFAAAYPYAIGPRLGLAYQIDPKTVLRAGWGLTYGQMFDPSTGATTGTGGWNTQAYSTAVFGDSAATLRNGLSYNLADLYNATLNPGIRPSPGQINSPPALVDPNAGRPPRINQWNISLQREVTKDLVVEAAYVGNRGVWFVDNALVDLNALTPERIKSVGLDVTNAADRTLLTSPLSSTAAQSRGFRAPYAGYSLGNTVAQTLRPFPQFGTLTTQAAPLGNTWYDSLQVKATKRLSHGLDILGTFAWQKEQNTRFNSQLNFVEAPVNDVFNRANQKQISSLSQPILLVVAFNYKLPALGPNRWTRAVIGGWTLGGILRYGSGLPIQVPLAQNNLAAVLFRGTFANRVSGQPLFVKNPNCHCIDPNKDFILNPAAWTDPAAGTWGTSASFYNDYRNQRHPDEQLSMGRQFRVREGMFFQIRAEFFNAFNRTALSPPNSTNVLQTQQRNSLGVPTAGFGRIDSSVLYNPPRSGQLVARFVW